MSSLNQKRKVDFSSVILDAEKIQQIEQSIGQINQSSKIFNEWGFGSIFEKGTAISMIFWGVPGTGKTMMAQAIANKLDQQLLVLGPAEIETSTPGGAERNIKRYFRVASGEEAPDDPNSDIDPMTGRPKPSNLPKRKHVLLFDECDSLITDRAKVGMVIAGSINTLLSELELFEGVVIFTTNRLGNLDKAIERRISAKIEFPFPDEELREKIWLRMIPKEAPLDKDVDFKRLAKFPLAGGNIKNVVLAAARKAAYDGLTKINLDCFVQAIKSELDGLESFDREIAKTKSNNAEEFEISPSGKLTITKQKKYGKL